MFSTSRVVPLLGWMILATVPGWGEEANRPPTDVEARAKQRLERFAEQYSQVKLVGHFTVTGKEDRALSKEEYTLQKVEKLPDGDKWIFHSRIKYGKHDLAIPLPIDVVWAGDTPVITLDDLTIPGLGTFGARVVLHEDKYAGTWKHDQVGGHLFGAIEKVKATDPPTEAPSGEDRNK